MSLERMLDERVNLKVRINLLEHNESTSPEGIDTFRAHLADLERLIAATRKADGA
jgi:hypothetical protein